VYSVAELISFLMKKKIAVVDDERAIADTLSLILSHAGYETSTAYNGQTGYELCMAVKPDLVISDVVMPELNGIEMAIKLIDDLPSLKILLFSGQAATADLLEGARGRGYTFEVLAKPVHPADLMAKVSSMLAGDERAAKAS
jgi:DNA-binding response OmpR family regulator